MILRCPYCKGPIPKDMVVTKMSARRVRIYDAVCASGPRGIEIRDLITVTFGKQPPRSAYGMLRVHIHAINTIITAYEQRITADRRGRYQLKERTDGETIKEPTQKANPERDHSSTRE